MGMGKETNATSHRKVCDATWLENPALDEMTRGQTAFRCATQVGGEKDDFWPDILECDTEALELISSKNNRSNECLLCYPGQSDREIVQLGCIVVDHHQLRWPLLKQG